MTVAAEVLALYSWDWGIDETPTLAFFVREAQDSGPTAPRSTSAGVEPLPQLQAWIDLLFTLAAKKGDGSADPSAGPAFMRRSVSMLPWTTGAVEMVSRTRRWLGAAVSGGNVDADLLEQSRGERAISAVKQLAAWLGTTAPDAADLAGKYRRSYYNWLRGAQPYPARTLDLYEAHAFVSGLVDALGERGARKWFAMPSGDSRRLDLLSTSEGRAGLSRMATAIMFRETDKAHWSPDDRLSDGALTRHRTTKGEFGQAQHIRSIRETNEDVNS
jgi:hypothetical protein